jgi:hypothetical protein
VSCGQRNGSLWPYSHISSPEPLLVLPSSSSFALTKLSGPCSRPTTFQKIWGTECGRCIRLTTLRPAVSKLSRQCGILNISQPYRPLQPATGIALLLLLLPLPTQSQPIKSNQFVREVQLQYLAQKNIRPGRPTSQFRILLSCFMVTV